jgi:hypothetical protein
MSVKDQLDIKGLDSSLGFSKYVEGRTVLCANNVAVA